MGWWNMVWLRMLHQHRLQQCRLLDGPLAHLSSDESLLSSDDELTETDAFEPSADERLSCRATGQK